MGVAHDALLVDDEDRPPVEPDRAEDAVRLGYEVTVLEDACRGIGLPTAPARTTIDDARTRLAAIGIRFASVADIG